jgi:polysaccharide export outer membrane protein
MRFERLLTTVALIAFAQPAQVSAQQAQEDAQDGDRVYTVQPGDMLEISVWNEPELQKEVLVAPDGGISFPLAGEMTAVGRSVIELRQEVTERLSRYIAEPIVTVTVSQILGNKIYVLGQVVRAGEFVVNPRVDVMQALSMAGGTTAFAALNDIVILRRQGDRQIAIPFRYGEVSTGRNLQQNIVLQSGDVVVVP